MDLGSESNSGSPNETVIDLTHSTGDSVSPFQLPVPCKNTHSVVKSAATLLSTTFSSLPQTGLPARPRSGSLESDQMLAIQKVISAACSSTPAMQKPVSKSVPPSPAHPVTGKPTQLVPPESRATSPPLSPMPSSLSPIPDAQRRFSASPLQDAQRPFSQSEEEYSVPFPDDSDQTIQGSPEKPDPPASLSSEDLIEFTETLFRKVHQSKVEHLPPQLIAMLYNINSFVAHNCSEILERLEDTQSSATDTLCESQLTHAIIQEANVALLEKSFNYETKQLREDISQLRTLTQTVHRDQQDVKSRVAPSAQLQRIASGLSDQQITFMKSLEYYMHRIGVRFEESPQFRDRLQKPEGIPPPVPLPPGRWPTKTPDDQRAILKLQQELIDLEQQYNFKVCAVANLEETTSELEQEAQVSSNRIDALHTDIVSFRKENSDLKKINAECSATEELSDTDPVLYTTTQANIQACRDRHLAVLAQKEAAKNIALARHEYTLAKDGLQAEIIRLKDEIRGLQATANVTASRDKVTTSAYSDRIQCLNKEIDDYKSQLKAVVSTNQELADKLNAILPTNSSSSHVMEVNSLQARVEELSASLKAVRIQNQEEISHLQADHNTTVTVLQLQLSQLQLRQDSSSSSHAAELLQRENELDHVQRSHAQTVESLQSELTALCQQAFTTRESMASTSSTMVSSLREEIDEQFHTIERLHTDLANTKRGSSSLQTELDRTKQELDRVKQDRVSLHQAREAHQADLASMHNDSLQAQEALTRANNMVNNLRDEVSHHDSIMNTSRGDLQTALSQNRDHRRTIVDLRTALQEAVDRQCSHNPNDCARSCPYVQPPFQTDNTEVIDHVVSVPMAPPGDTVARSVSDVNPSDPPRRSPSPVPEASSLEWLPILASTESWADNCDREAASPPSTIPPTLLLPLANVDLAPSTSAMPVAASAFTPSLVTATSIISSSTITTSSRAVPTSLAPSDPVTVTPPQEEASSSVAPPLASPQAGPFNPRNDYNWVPTAPASCLKPKAHDKPWTLFIGDSLLRHVNTSGVISGGQNNKQFQPHMQAVAWDLQDLAGVHSKPSRWDRPGYDYYLCGNK